jgi:hypothetical protein
MKDNLHDQDETTAYHEAAHAVVADWFGWWLSPEGVMIGKRDYCGLRLQAWQSTDEAAVCVSLAGWSAEMRLAPERAKPREDDELQDVIEDRKLRLRRRRHRCDKAAPCVDTNGRRRDLDRVLPGS